MKKKQFEWNLVLQEQVDKIIKEYKNKMIWGKMPKEDAIHSIIYHALQFYRVDLIPRILEKEKELKSNSKINNYISELEFSDNPVDINLAKTLKEIYKK